MSRSFSLPQIVHFMSSCLAGEPRISRCSSYGGNYEWITALLVLWLCSITTSSASRPRTKRDVSH